MPDDILGEPLKPPRWPTQNARSNSNSSCHPNTGHNKIVPNSTRRTEVHMWINQEECRDTSVLSIPPLDIISQNLSAILMQSHHSETLKIVYMPSCISIDFTVHIVFEYFTQWTFASVINNLVLKYNIFWESVWYEYHNNTNNQLELW